MDKIIIKGAREHNLKNIDLELPRDKLIVISGLSGSGKSSLAFDTIYAEGQRRYVESLSSYARQFLGRMDKPDLDYIEGLSPAISIEQKTTSRNPRSTVGTVTEIYDYLRLLYARIGTQYCHICGREIKEQSIDQIIDAVLSKDDGAKVMLLAPVIQGQKGTHVKILDDSLKAGFARARIDGEIYNLDEEIKLKKNVKHTIEIVVDRLKVDKSNRRRVAESVETCLDLSGGQIIIIEKNETNDVEEFFSQKAFCTHCSVSFPELQPRMFSFNNPFGACDSCSGLGMTMEFEPRLIMPDLSLSFNDGGILSHSPKGNWNTSRFEALARHYDFSLDTPLGELSEDVMNILLYGTDEKIEVTYINKDKQGKFEYTGSWKGIIADLKRRYMESSSDGVKDWLEGFMTNKLCTSCHGARLKAESRAVLINSKSIIDISSMSIMDAESFFNKLELSERDAHIATQIVKEIRERLSFLTSVGLDYLTLDRTAATLSGGEAQRIRLATQIGSSLMGVLYILDEPSIGLHQRDNERLIQTLTHLRDLGNTVIVVEHDEQTLLTADHIVDLGPGAGVHGGRVVASGTVDEVMESSESLTGQYLKGSLEIPIPEERRKGNGLEIKVLGASEHNLKDINVSFPLGTFSVLTGVSGSGKSTLLTDILFPSLHNATSRSRHEVGAHRGLEGHDNIDKVINIDQSPIGRTPRSNPATYVGLFTPIRELFSSLPEAKSRGYKAGRFSFNVAGGRCENCHGDGTIKIEMHFLPDVYVTCDVCKGKRFNHETLEIRYKGKNIHDVLEMTVEEALPFFEAIPKIKNKLATLESVGLEYIKLGQSALTFSGGEAQRIKLSLELSKRSTGKTFYILDEPTTGLHFADVKKLVEVLQLLVEKGNTVVLIEHNLDVIAQADHIIDLGPEGGNRGGTLIGAGTPELIANTPESHTGRFIKEILERRKK